MFSHNPTHRSTANSANSLPRLANFSCYWPRKRKEKREKEKEKEGKKKKEKREERLGRGLSEVEFSREL